VVTNQMLQEIFQIGSAVEMNLPVQNVHKWLFKLEMDSKIVLVQGLSVWKFYSAPDNSE